jgi:ABC-type multidrug transport system fused ATPase/permease subunit
MLREYRKLFGVTGSGWRFAFLLLLRAPFDMASTLIQATFLQHAFNAIGRQDSTALRSACVMFGVASLCLFLYNGTVWSVYAPFCARLEGKLRAKLFNKISSLSYVRVESSSHGEWLTRLNTDVEAPFSRGFHFPHAACAIVNISVSATILWRMNPAVLGWVLLFVLPHIAVSQLLIARAMPGLHKKSLTATAKNTSDMTALITCADVAALYDAQEYLMHRFEQSSRALWKANMKIRARNALSAGILPLFALGGYLTLLVISSNWIADGGFTFGDLTAAFQFRGGMLTGSMILISCMISIGASMAGVRRLNETLTEKTEEL